MPTHDLTIQAPVTVVRHYLTTADSIERYFARSAVVEENGPVMFTWEDGFAHGVFTTFDDDHLTLTWHADDATTEVDITLNEEDGETVLHLECGESASERWQTGLANLKHRLEHGMDLRVAKLPRLGVFPQAIVTEPVVGSLITGVSPGSGPDQIGMKGGDIIHTIEGVVIDAYPKFREALADKNGGDEIRVVYFRGDERHEGRFALTTMADLAPELPASLEELAERYAERRDAALATLKEMFAGASDVQANTPPAEGEWSAINVIAHLIHTERWTHQMIFNRLNDRPYSAYGANDDLQIVPYSTLYNTVDLALGALEAELERTRLLILNLPEAVFERRDVLHDITQGVLSNPTHIQSHYDQVAEALAAAYQPA